VATLVLPNDRWDAGWALLRAADPGDGNDAAMGYNIVQANRDELAACQQVATKEEKDQKCDITVRAQ
jgi:hypothetical protein